MRAGQTPTTTRPGPGSTAATATGAPWLCLYALIIAIRQY